VLVVGSGFTLPLLLLGLFIAATPHADPRGTETGTRLVLTETRCLAPVVRPGFCPVVKLNASRFLSLASRFLSLMSAVIEAPIEMVEAVADLHLPPRADQRLEDLMDRNNNGALSPEEREQLESLVELSEAIAIVRAQAIQPLQVESSATSRYRTCGGLSPGSTAKCSPDL